MIFPSSRKELNLGKSHFEAPTETHPGIAHPTLLPQLFLERHVYYSYNIQKTKNKRKQNAVKQEEKN